MLLLNKIYKTFCVICFCHIHLPYYLCCNSKYTTPNFNAQEEISLVCICNSICYRDIYYKNEVLSSAPLDCSLPDGRNIQASDPGRIHLKPSKLLKIFEVARNQCQVMGKTLCGQHGIDNGWGSASLTPYSRQITPQFCRYHIE